MPPIKRLCRQCQQPFVITPHEQEFFRRLAAAKADGTDWQLPWRCDACRRLRRRAREVVDVDAGDQVLTCCDCGEPFVFGGRDRAFFAERGFPQPRRCRPCRRARTARKAKASWHGAPPDKGNA